ncbi:hypothetical protein AALP_AAs70920U000100 [Arabis alpina]|uniref:Uncharacterized protein n=1 Tax=Arabis alpina TaxID=50452 RepID=A0A087FWJ6_ARAAL|nr:hypothetical protein AALP_AAs70920U000100 [Arabis alpina]
MLVFFTNVVVSVRSSRWRKECKHHLQNQLCSIRVHRKRRMSMIRQSRSDIAQLLRDGRLSETLPKAKQSYEDDRRIRAYDYVEYLCKSILENLSPLTRQSDVNLLPGETKEAMAGLIFAASRMGELKELPHIRSLFFERFGREFDKECVDLRRGNVVSSVIIKILNARISQEAKITPEIVIGIVGKDQTNVITSTESSEDSVAEKIKKLETVVERFQSMKENSQVCAFKSRRV